MEISGEILGVEHPVGTLYLLAYADDGPALYEMRDGSTTKTWIATGPAGELISLQMWNGDLLTLDYQAGIVYELVAGHDSYSLVQFLDLDALLSPEQRCEGRIRGMCFTDEAWCFTSLSFEGNPGKLHGVPNHLDAIAEASRGASAIDGFAVILNVEDHPEGYSDGLMGHLNRDRMVNMLADFGWQQDNIVVLLDTQVTEDTVEDAIQWLLERVSEGDVVLFYAFGHYSFFKNEVQLDAILENAWQSIPTRHKLLIIDSCYGAQFANAGYVGDTEQSIAEDDVSRGIAVSSVSYDEVSWGAWRKRACR